MWHSAQMEGYLPVGVKTGRYSCGKQLTNRSTSTVILMMVKAIQFSHPSTTRHAYYTLRTPKTQKAAVRGLIDEIIVHPTAALYMQCDFFKPTK